MDTGQTIFWAESRHSRLIIAQLGTLNCTLGRMMPTARAFVGSLKENLQYLRSSTTTCSLAFRRELSSKVPDSPSIARSSNASSKKFQLNARQVVTQHGACRFQSCESAGVRGSNSKADSFRFTVAMVEERSVWMDDFRCGSIWISLHNSSRPRNEKPYLLIPVGCPVPEPQCLDSRRNCCLKSWTWRRKPQGQNHKLPLRNGQLWGPAL